MESEQQLVYSVVLACLVQVTHDVEHYIEACDWSNLPEQTQACVVVRRDYYFDIHAPNDCLEYESTI